MMHVVLAVVAIGVAVYLFRRRSPGHAEPLTFTHPTGLIGSSVSVKSGHRARVGDKKGALWSCDHAHAARQDALVCAREAIDDARSKRPQVRPHVLAEGIGVPTNVAPRASITDLPAGDWARMQAAFSGKCRYCRQPGHALVREHRIPLSRGGPNAAANIVPACPACNSAKASATEDEYVPLIRRFFNIRVSVPAAAARLLAELDAKGGGEDRNVTLLRSLRLPPDPMGDWPAPTGAVLLIGALGDPARKDTPITGISYRDADARRALGRKGEWKGQAALVPDPNNRHDPHAIKVLINGIHVGFVPRDVAARHHGAIREQWDAGRAVAVRAVLFRSSNGTGGRLGLPGDPYFTTAI